jgi:hypothetical protein
MPPDEAVRRWVPSREPRILLVVSVLIAVAVWYLVLRVFFPAALVLPLTALAAGFYIVAYVRWYEVLLDTVNGMVVISHVLGTYRVRLARIESARGDRSGLEIRISGGWSTAITGLDRQPLKRWRRGQGAEEMVAAITRAAEAARVADPGPAALPGRRGIPGPAVLLGVGLLSMVAAVLVHPQVGGRLVAVLAVILAIGFGLAGAVAILLGALMLRPGSPFR